MKIHATLQANPLLPLVHSQYPFPPLVEVPFHPNLQTPDPEQT
jgi:hypothetical protein